MRVKLKSEVLSPMLGDEREIEKFLFLPKKIGLEIRWFEYVRIKQKYEEYLTSYDMGGETNYGWIDKAWAPSDPVKDCPIYKSEQGCAHVDGMICDIKSCAEYEKHSNSRH